MSNKQQLKPIAAALGTAFAISLAVAPATHAAENPFAMSDLSSGYQVAMGDKPADKKTEGKCGEGKCGGDKAKEGKCGGDKAKEGKCGEGKCGGSKAKEGKCGGKKDADEGKCGEGKCGTP